MGMGVGEQCVHNESLPQFQHCKPNRQSIYLGLFGCGYLLLLIRKKYVEHLLSGLDHVNQI